VAFELLALRDQARKQLVGFGQRWPDSTNSPQIRIHLLRLAHRTVRPGHRAAAILGEGWVSSATSR